MQQRKYPRVDENWKFKYRVVESQTETPNPIDSLAINISGGGICFSSREAVTPGSMLTMEMHSAQFGQPIIAMAKAVWCQKQRTTDLFDIGCEFWWVGWKDDNAQQSLSDYIKSHTSDTQE
jgi:c-di-GMP-binding flagellar brake protein YcgR